MNVFMLCAICFVIGAFIGFLASNIPNQKEIDGLRETIINQADREIKLSVKLKEYFHYLRAFEKSLDILGKELHKVDDSEEEETFIIKKKK